jgi:hypothetical protein
MTLGFAPGTRRYSRRFFGKKKVSIAWVIRDAITRYPTDQTQKKGGGNPTNVLPPMLVFSHEPQIYPRDING